MVTLATKHDRARIRLFESHLGVRIKYLEDFDVLRNGGSRGEQVLASLMHACSNTSPSPLLSLVCLLTLLHLNHPYALPAAAILSPILPSKGEQDGESGEEDGEEE